MAKETESRNATFLVAYHVVDEGDGDVAAFLSEAGQPVECEDFKEAERLARELWKSLKEGTPSWSFSMLVDAWAEVPEIDKIRIFALVDLGEVSPE